MVSIFKMALGMEEGVEWDGVAIHEVGVNDKNICECEAGRLLSS